MTDVKQWTTLDRLGNVKAQAAAPPDGAEDHAQITFGYISGVSAYGTLDEVQDFLATVVSYEDVCVRVCAFSEGKRVFQYDLDAELLGRAVSKAASLGKLQEPVAQMYLRTLRVARELGGEKTRITAWTARTLDMLVTAAGEEFVKENYSKA